MGTLRTLHEVKQTPDYYFSDSYFGIHGWIYSWPSQNYQFSSAIHGSSLSKNRGLKVQIRKWIESSLAETVIRDSIDYSYEKYFSDVADTKIPSYMYQDSYTIKNDWEVFYFETSEAKMLFDLQFSEYVRPLTKWSPLLPEHEEYQRIAAERNIRIFR